MKPIITLLLVVLSFSIKAQSNVYQDLPIFKNGLVNETVSGALKVQKNSHIHVDVPDKNYGLSLHKVDLLSDNFSIKLSKGRKAVKVDGVFYQGTVDGIANSIATLSVFKDNVVCTFSDECGNFEIVGDKSKPYKLTQVLPQKSNSFECYTEDVPVNAKGVNAPESPTLTCKAIQVYFEADYKLYQDKGSSVVNTVNYVTALFNQVAALYANEQVVVQISQIKVWNTPDPYIQFTNTASVLNAFRNTIGANFNGNLAHFLSSRPLGGGIAYVDVLCAKSYAFGVSAITSTFNNIPTYSWSVEVITHELGHNIGSWHTQSCNWPNGPLDNCYSPEGNCLPGPAPINGGTIMSYCHLTSYGINFANGFGPVPGNLIRNKFNTASCLTGTSAAPTGLQVNNITNSGATLTWNAVPGTQSYTVQYKQISSGTWITLSTGINTYLILSGLSQNTSYHWKIKTDCSPYTLPVSFNTTGQGGPCTTTLVPSISNITQTSALVTWTPISGVTVYHLQYKAASAVNWIEYGFIPSNSLPLSNLTSNTTYMVKVRPNCNENFGTVVQFTTLGNGGTCTAPTGLQVNNITATSATLSWTPQSFATGYNLQLKLPNSNTWLTFASTFTVTSLNFYGFQPSSTYQWRIKNQCSDWSAINTFTTPANFVEEPVIYPNPTRGLFRLGDVIGEAQLFNASGNKVGDFTLDGGFIEITNLPNGVYYLRVLDKFFKIVKI